LGDSAIDSPINTVREGKSAMENVTSRFMNLLEQTLIPDYCSDSARGMNAAGFRANPKLADVRDRAVASVKADADRFAKNVAPIIREIQSSGDCARRRMDGGVIMSNAQRFTR
jgi:hypothetical protein